MTIPDFDKKAAEILPCRDSFYCELPNCDHTKDCPASYRPAVSATLREMYEKGVKDTEQWMQMGWA